MAKTPKKKPTASRAEAKSAAQAKRQARQEKAARAAEALKAQQRRRKRNERLIVAGVVAALVLIVGGGWWYQSSRDSARENAAAPANAVDEFALAIGDPDAEHEVVIYEDFLCPACQQFELSAGDVLAQAAEEGRAYVKFHPIEILGRYGDYSKQSANALAVVLDAHGPEVAKEFHDLLFEKQPSESGQQPDEDWLIEQAVAAGADEDEIRPGIEDGEFELWVENATEHSSKEGVTGTPTVRVNGEDFNGDVAALTQLLS